MKKSFIVKLMLDKTSLRFFHVLNCNIVINVNLKLDNKVTSILVLFRLLRVWKNRVYKNFELIFHVKFQFPKYDLIVTFNRSVRTTVISIELYCG